MSLFKDKKIKFIIENYEYQIKEIFDEIDKIVKEESVSIEEVKHVKSTPFRFKLKQKRFYVSQSLEGLRNKWLKK